MPVTDPRWMEIYQSLYEHYGPQGWWPADTPNETIIGCILVQHTNWQNVERAIANLKATDMLNFVAIDRCSMTRLSAIIRPAGTPNVKSRRLKAFAHWLNIRYDFDLPRLLTQPLDVLRGGLLGVNGIGPETADCIALYAAGLPSFVVDHYARRVMTRHLLADRAWTYDQLKNQFEKNLPAQAALYNEFHALLVAVGKQFCRKSPLCTGCPLEPFEHQIEGQQGD